MRSKVRIAIDGPVASGKSTIGRDLARVLGCLYLDTGIMYRGVTALVLDRGLAPADESGVTALARAVAFDFPQLSQADAVNPPLLADGVDITNTLRLPEVERYVSAVSSYGGVRSALVEQQRSIAATRSVVMVGRDIGTVVLPDAEIKIFLTAGVEERAQRRHLERLASGTPDDLAETLADLKRRDRLDSERAISPLRAADDAVLVDTTGLSQEQALEQALAVIRVRQPEALNP